MGSILSILANLPLDRTTISDLSGTASFLVWLFAQSPQLYENYSRSSVEGLSPVFLLQWASGDLTNLIGCLLTHQLPFQIAVATYFCIVDCCIAAQYYYYWRRDRLLESRAAQRRSKSHSRRFSQALETSHLLRKGVGIEDEEERIGRSSSASRPRRKRTDSNWSYHSWRAGSLNRSVGLDSREESESSENEDVKFKHELQSKSENPVGPNQIEYEQHYFNFRPTSPTRKRIPIYATDLIGTNSYRALSQTALSVAELAEEAARRSLESSRIYEDGYGRKYVRGNSRSSSRPASVRSFSKTSSNAILSPELNAKGKKRSKSRRESREWGSIHPHTELSPTRENTTVNLEGSKSQRRERKAIPLNHNLIDSFTSQSSSGSRNSYHDWEGKRRTNLGINTSTGLEGTIRSTHENSKGKKRAKEDATGNLKESIESLKSLESTTSGSNSSHKSEKEVEEEIRGRALNRNENPPSLNRLNNSHQSQSPCPSDLTTMPNSSRDQVANERPAVPSRSRSRNLSKRFLPNLSSKKKSQSPSTSRRSGAGIVLLAVWTLFTFGFGNRQPLVSPSLTQMRGNDDWNLNGPAGKGQVISPQNHLIKSNQSRESSHARYDSPFDSETSQPYYQHNLPYLRHPSLLYYPSISLSDVANSSMDPRILHLDGDEDDEPLPRPPPVDVSWERIIGRISAWTCTVLYMTSRIPQIWENMRRKSVAGLSILLFLAAFTGNLLYTISILSNPLASGPTSKAYLAESIPFLLGSGGTLGFDFIIVLQWFAWRNQIETSHSHHGSSSHHHHHHHHRHHHRSERSSSKPRTSRNASSSRMTGSAALERSKGGGGREGEGRRKTWSSKSASKRRESRSPQASNDPVFKEVRQRENSAVSIERLP